MSELDELRREVEDLRDRQAIRDVVMRLARGVDRHDAELMNSCFHADAVVRHANAASTIKGSEYGQWSNDAHSGGDRFVLHSHQITNQNVLERDGDVAIVESYVITAFLGADLQRTSLAFGRYVDRMEKRDGEWRIAARRAFLDIAAEGDATYFGNAKKAVDHDDFWAPTDISYRRPVDLDGPAPQWT